MTDFSHLEAIYARLASETIRLNASKSDFERKQRAVWVEGIRREIAGEYAFLGIDPPTAAELNGDVDELYAALAPNMEVKL